MATLSQSKYNISLKLANVPSNFAYVMSAYSSASAPQFTPAWTSDAVLGRRIDAACCSIGNFVTLFRV